MTPSIPLQSPATRTAAAAAALPEPAATRPASMAVQQGATVRRSRLFRRLVDCDRTVSRSVAYDLPHPPRATRALGAFSRCGDHGYVWYGLAAVMALAGDSRRAGRFWYVAGGQAAAELLTHLVKIRIRRGRPPHDDRRPDGYIRQPTSHSFPSAHASMGVVGVVTLTRLYPRLGAPLAALLAVLAFTRVFLRVHYAADVAAGLGFGAVIAALYSWFVPAPE